MWLKCWKALIKKKIKNSPFPASSAELVTTWNINRLLKHGGCTHTNAALTAENKTALVRAHLHYIPGHKIHYTQMKRYKMDHNNKRLIKIPFSWFISWQTALFKKFSQTPHAYSMIIKLISGVDCGFVKVVIMHRKEPVLDDNVFFIDTWKNWLLQHTETVLIAHETKLTSQSILKVFGKI